MNGKRRVWRAVLAAVVAITLLSAAIVGLRALLPGRPRLLALLPGRPRLLAQAGEIGAAAERDAMRVSVACVDDAMRTLSGSQTLTATNRTGADRQEAVLRLFANAAGGRIALSDVRVNGEAADWAYGEDGLSARIQADWKAGETIELAWRFEATLPQGAGTMHAQDGVTLAIGAVPTLATWNGEGWDTAAGELAEYSYADAFDYELRLSVPEHADAAFGGAPVARERGGVTVARMEGARDVSFALFPRRGGELREQQAGGVLLTVQAKNGANRLMEASKEALRRLAAVGLAYPFPSLTVVQAETGMEDGAIGSGLIAVPPEADTERLTQRLTRLIARQIFGVQVENDPWQSPWLSQSLASAAELLAYRREKGETAHETRFYGEIEVATRLTRPRGVTVGAETASFGGDGEMTQVLRDQGAAGLLGIEQAVGEDAFLRALTRYAQENAGGMGGAQTLLDALEAETGSRWDGYLRDVLSM